jgi:hypothetical protein
MACACGEQFQRTFPVTVQYTVYFDQSGQASPVRWTQDRLRVCINCGEITGSVPNAELQVLREGAGETAA